MNGKGRKEQETHRKHQVNRKPALPVFLNGDKSNEITAGFLRSNLAFQSKPPLFSTGNWSSLQQQSIEGYFFFGLRSFQAFPEPQSASFLCRSHRGNWTQTSFFYSASRKRNKGSTRHSITPDITPVTFPSLVFSSPTTRKTHANLQTIW